MFPPITWHQNKKRRVRETEKQKRFYLLLAKTISIHILLSISKNNAIIRNVSISSALSFPSTRDNFATSLKTFLASSLEHESLNDLHVSWSLSSEISICRATRITK